MLTLLHFFITSILVLPGQIALAEGDEDQKLRTEQVQRSRNFRKGKFRNQVETPTMASDVSFWQILKARFAAKNLKPETRLTPQKSDLKTAVPVNELQVTWFGHSTILVQLGGANFLIDPIFSQRASPVQFIGPKNFEGTRFTSVSGLPPIDYVLISHNHYDHLDKRTIKALGAKTGRFYVPLGTGEHLVSWGVPAEKIQELDWWDEVQLSSGLWLAATPSRHFSGRGLTDGDENLWASYVLKSKDHSVYLSGDSGYGPHFKQIGDKYGPFDLTLMECGQYSKYWPHIHMQPEQTAQAHLDLKGKLLLPIHWSKFALSLHPWAEPVDRLLLRSAELGVDVTTPKMGQPIRINGKPEMGRWWREISDSTRYRK